MAKTTHFCMGHAMKSEIGFGEKHLDCGMDMDMDQSENEEDNHQDKKSCCENITEHLQVDEDVQLKKFEAKIQFNFAVALFEVFLFGYSGFLSAVSSVDVQGRLVVQHHSSKVSNWQPIKTL